MKTLVFDTGSIISLAINNLLWILDPLKKSFKGEFYIPDSVKFELVDKPLTTKLFKLEAIMINKSILEGQFLVHEALHVDTLLEHLNQVYTVEGKPLHILDRGEVEALSLVLRLQADAYVVDERTMRLMIEGPELLKTLLEKKLQKPVEMDKKLVKEFLEIVKGVNVLRSTELVLLAYEQGLLNKFLTPQITSETLLDGLLWGLRLRGCSISTQEINDLIKLETNKSLFS